MKNLMTQKIVFGMLMTLVLAFSVQSPADAIVTTDFDLSTGGTDLGNLVIGATVSLSVTVTPDISTRNESISLSVSGGGARIALDGATGKTSHTFTEDDTDLTDTTEGNLTTGTLVLTVNSAGEVTVRLRDTTSNIPSGDQRAAEQVLTFYVVKNRLDVSQSDTISLRGVTNGVGHPYDHRGDIQIYSGDGRNNRVTYTLDSDFSSGNLYVKKGNRARGFGDSLETSSTAQVWLSMGARDNLSQTLTAGGTNLVTATVNGNGNTATAVYIYGRPSLAVVVADSIDDETGAPVPNGSEITDAFTATVMDEASTPAAVPNVPVKFEVKDKSLTGGRLFYATAATIVDSSNREISNPPQGVTTLYVRTVDTSTADAKLNFQLGAAKRKQVVSVSALGKSKDATAYANVDPDRTLTLIGRQRRGTSNLYDLAVEVRDDGDIKSGVTVSFSTIKGTIPATRNTDSSGQVRVVYDSDGESGVLEVLASVHKTANAITNDTPESDKIKLSINVRGGSITQPQDTQPSTGTAGITLNLDPIRGAPDDTVTLQATVRDTGGNVDTNATVNFTISDNSGRVSPSSARTNANGVAQTTVTIPDDDATLTATVSGYTGSRYTDQVNVIVDAAATDLEVVSGSGQTGAPGSTLSSPFVVRFEDSDGEPVSGAVVRFAVETGGGSVSSSTDTTDSDGEAETTLTLGSAGGRNTVRASVSGTDYPGVSSVTITADAARPAEAVTIAGGDDQIGQVGRLLDEDLSVQVVDSQDNGISGVLVRFRITEGRGRLSRNSDRTDTDGYAEIGFTPTADGETVVEAYTTGLSSAFFTINTGEPPAAIVLVSGNNQSGKPGAKLANPFVVEVVDENDDPVSGVSVTFAVTAGGGTLSTTSATTGSNGRAQTRLTLGEELGANTVQARVAGLTDRVTFNAKSGAEVLVDVTQRAPMYWISRKEGKLHRLVGEQIENLVPNVTGITSIAVDTTNNLLYFGVKTNDNRGAIRRANLNGSNAKVVRSLSSAPVDIAVDSQGKQVYWLTQGGGIRSIATAGGGQVRDVATNLPNPTEIVLSPNGFVYWAEPLGRIRRVRLTGTQAQRTPQTIVTGLGEPRGLSVSGGKIYWIDFNGSGGDSLRRANLDGTDRQKLKRFTVSKNVPRDMAVRSATKQIYWTRPNGKLQVSNLWGNFAKDIVTGLENPGAIVLGPGVAEVPIDQSTQPTQPTTPTTYSVYDVNKDGAVNNADLKIVSRVITGAATHARADVDGSGTVDITDLILVIGELEDDVAAPAIDVDVKALDIDFDRVQEQVETLLASGDRSIAAQRALLYLQHLLASARPDETVLLANYPNPFNPETWIPYHLAESTDVRVNIYDAQGVLVRALTLGHQMAGYYTSRSRAAYWDGRNALGERVASGVYFYQLETDEISPMRKMVILK